MPIYNDTYGYGEYTLKKLSDFDKFMEDYLAIAQAVQSKHRYKTWCDQTFHYIDLNAGPGILPDLLDKKSNRILVPIGTEGSPLLFTRWADYYKLNYQVDFIESNPILANQLSGYTSERVWNKDHNLAVFDILPEFIKWKFGLIYHDPNNGTISFDALHHCARMRPKYEILINFPGALFKRSPESYRDEVFISDHMDKLKKNFWLIKDLVASDKHQWTFLLGTNFKDIKDFLKIGMYRIDKPKGANIFERVNLSKRQLENKYQMRMF